MTSDASKHAVPVHVTVKPIGPICNLKCEYCYYLDKETLYPPGESFLMSDSLLENYIRQHLEAQLGPEVVFAWQGGEPTLVGIDFFRKVVSLEKRYLPAGWQCTNALQTNGTMLNDEWCEFFKENGFLIGISLDGPAELHDRYRVDKGQRPTHAKVVRGLELLQRHEIDYNVLCVVDNVNSRYPLEVYRFFKDIGVTWLQFIPLVEREKSGGVSPRSVAAGDYGRFLASIFDEWVREDVGTVFIQTFEECVRVWFGLPANLCTFNERCGRAVALEHNGDLFACDHFVQPEFKLGNINLVPLRELVESPRQRQFGFSKQAALPKYCRECDVRFMCNGGCPKDRFITAPDGEKGLSYLCEGYHYFFKHVEPHMRRMKEMWQKGIPLQTIMAETSGRSDW